MDKKESLGEFDEWDEVTHARSWHNDNMGCFWLHRTKACAQILELNVFVMRRKIMKVLLMGMFRRNLHVR